MKKLLLFFFLLTSLNAEGIEGYWKSLNDETGKTECVVAIYKYHDKYYGRIVATYDKEGVMKETWENPKERAPGILGNPYYCGLDLLWDLKYSGKSYKGKVVDPQKGKIYRAEVWLDPKENLILRGKLLCFGRNKTWPPALESDFGKGFTKPDVAKFIPVIPQIL